MTFEEWWDAYAMQEPWTLKTVAHDAWCSAEANLRIETAALSEERVQLIVHPDLGVGKLIGIYEGNKFPYHVVFDGTSKTFTYEEFCGFQRINPNDL